MGRSVTAAGASGAGSTRRGGHCKEDEAMRRRTVIAVLLSAGIWLAPALTPARGHCQIPCGIYDDPARFTRMLEHVRTIEKSMHEIGHLSESKTPDWNQLVRWVTNKEAHADKLSEIVTFYFMAQRIKPADPGDKAAYAKYVREVTLLHRMMVAAMKAKQTVDPAHCKTLRDLIGRFRKSYLGKRGG
jgi:nickel superoxide dismutase